MRDSKLMLLFAGWGLMLGTGCFLTTESEEYTAGAGGSGSSCAVGAPGCACTGSGACDDGLECVDMLNVCVVPTDCAIGSAGCECTQGGTCDPGLLCADVEPAPGICVSDAPCLPENTGAESCQCTEGGGCDIGLTCLSGMCVQVPEDTSTGETEPSEDSTDTGEVQPSGSSTGSSTGADAEASTGVSSASTGA